MKRQLFFALFIVIFSAVALSQVSKKSVQDLSKVEKEVNEVIHQRLDALRRGDAKAYASYFGDDCIITGDNEIGSYNLLLGTSSAQPQLLPSLDSMLRVIEPLADWEFLARQERRILLKQPCADISVYQYKVNSLTLNVGVAPQSAGRYTGSHSTASPSR
jgi:hypothetical protein